MNDLSSYKVDIFVVDVFAVYFLLFPSHDCIFLQFLTATGLSLIKIIALGAGALVVLLVIMCCCCLCCCRRKEIQEERYGKLHSTQPGHRRHCRCGRGRGQFL